MFPDFDSSRLHILLSKKRVSVTLKGPEVIPRKLLDKVSPKSTDPAKSINIEAVPSMCPYTRIYEEKIDILTLLEEESNLSKKINDPEFPPKKNQFVAAISGIRSIALENNALDLE